MALSRPKRSEAAKKAAQTRKRRSDAKNFDRKVDINILLNKVRAEEKKERYESIVFFGLIATVILVTGVIVSL